MLYMIFQYGTGSNTADINRIRSHTGNNILLGKQTKRFKTRNLGKNIILCTNITE